MLLAIDAGNTNIVFALFERGKIVKQWRVATNIQRTADEFAVFLKQAMADGGLKVKSVRAAIIGSVVPDLNFSLIKLCRDHFGCEPLLVGSKDVDTGLEIAIDRPEELGADRIMNAVAARAKHEGPVLVIDFGTATTFDVVDGHGVYRGGCIAPGVNLSLRALHMAAAKLPSVAIVRPPKVIARNTVTAIQSGLYWGYAGLIEGLVYRIREEFGRPMIVIATGGLASLMAGAVRAIDHIDPDLTLRGLALIFDCNKKKRKKTKNAAA